MHIFLNCTIFSASVTAFTAWSDASSCNPTNLPAGCSAGTHTNRECQTIKRCGNWIAGTRHIVATCAAVAQNNTCDMTTFPTSYRTCVATRNYTPTWAGLQIPSQKVY